MRRTLEFHGPHCTWYFEDKSPYIAISQYSPGPPVPADMHSGTCDTLPGGVPLKIDAEIAGPSAILAVAWESYAIRESNNTVASIAKYLSTSQQFPTDCETPSVCKT